MTAPNSMIVFLGSGGDSPLKGPGTCASCHFLWSPLHPLDEPGLRSLLSPGCTSSLQRRGLQKEGTWGVGSAKGPSPTPCPHHLALPTFNCGSTEGASSAPAEAPSLRLNLPSWTAFPRKKMQASCLPTSVSWHQCRQSYRLNRGLEKQEGRERKRKKGPPLLIWASELLTQGCGRRRQACGSAGLPGQRAHAVSGRSQCPILWSQGGCGEGSRLPEAAEAIPHLHLSQIHARKEWLLPQGSSTTSHLLLSPWYLALSPSLVTPGDISVCYWTKNEKNKEFKAPQRVLI